MASRKAGLEDEGRRLGAEFRLGRCTDQWKSSGARPRLLWGVVILVLMQGGGILAPFAFTGLSRVIAACVGGDLVVLGVAMVALPPRTRQDRLFRYDRGVILMAEREPEPQVLRWADLASVTRKTGSGYEGPYLKACELRDRAGRVLVMRDGLSPGIELVAARADAVLARRQAGEALPDEAPQDEVSQDEVLQDDAGAATGTALTLPWKRGKRRWPLPAAIVTLAVEGAVIGFLAATAAPAPPPPMFPADAPQAQPAPQGPPPFRGWPGAPAARDVSLQAGARPTGVGAYPQSALAYAFTGGTGADTVDIDGQAWREDIATGASTPLGFIPAFANAIGAVSAVSPDGSTVAMAGASGVDLYSTGSGARTVVLRADLTDGVAGASGPTSMAISPDGRWLVADDTDGNAHLWSLATRQSYLLAVSATGSAYGDAFAFAPDSRELAVSTGDGSVFLWDVATRELDATLINGPDSPASVTAIAFGEGGALLAVAGGDGYVYVVDVATRSVIGTLRDIRNPREAPVLVTISPDGRLLAAEFSTDGDTEVWSVASGESVGWLPGPQSDSDVQVGFSPDSRHLVFAQIGDPGLRIFNVYASK